ncbi:polymerase (RNA) II (DNA directed) polypeptide F [Columba livia]|uniref:Polymerase (RNA) II (DNA directed) polypeptide F n=1 Tax=Columba livia TaxID=8932 RepID=A0A2I0MJC9_COLLI|nr:polymerase (RNA) II (DNA directed) polypeptide F [Columba livia]
MWRRMRGWRTWRTRRRRDRRTWKSSPRESALHDQVRASQSAGHSRPPDRDVRPCDGGAGRRDRPLADCHERTQSTQDPHNHPSLPTRWEL